MQNEIPIIYSDAELLVVNKPSGLLCVPDRYDPDAPLITDLLASTEGQLFVVHRLDKETSGALVFARSAAVHKELSQLFETRAVQKTYHSLVYGRPTWEYLDCDLPLKIDGDREHRTVVDKREGKASSTHFRVLETYAGTRGFSASLIEARPNTGRTHQIRAHLAALEHAVLCDSLYALRAPTNEGSANSARRREPEEVLHPDTEYKIYLSQFKAKWKGDAYDERPLLARLALHALKLEFARQGKQYCFEAEMPKDLRSTIAQLRKLKR